MRIRLALTPRVTRRDNINCPRPEVNTLVRTRTLFGTGWAELNFVVDTGADVSIVPVVVALEMGIPFVRQVDPLPIRTRGGIVHGHLGEITVTIAELQFTWACYFTEAPPGPAIPKFTVPPPLSRPPASVGQWASAQGGAPSQLTHTCLLGRAGVLTRDFDLGIDKTHFWLVWRRAPQPWWRRVIKPIVRFLKRDD